MVKTPEINFFKRIRNFLMHFIQTRKLIRQNKKLMREYYCSKSLTNGIIFP